MINFITRSMWIKIIIFFCNFEREKRILRGTHHCQCVTQLHNNCLLTPDAQMSCRNWGQQNNGSMCTRRSGQGRTHSSPFTDAPTGKYLKCLTTIIIYAVTNATVSKSLKRIYVRSRCVNKLYWLVLWMTWCKLGRQHVL